MTMGILEFIDKGDAKATEKFIAEAPNVSWLIRECINAGVQDKLLEQSKSFFALGIRHIVQFTLTGTNLLNRLPTKQHLFRKAS